ncbi:hypothetical protein BYT27DRAFT_7255584 [Phlegmacium glaucopus]|nr:hypothetical protein BYT27DRAFT_7255584 [Phlegmacium glaucopus]
MPAFPDSPPISPAFPAFPKSADSAEVPPFPNSPPIPPVPDSVSMPPLPESSTIPNFPGLASDPNSSSPCPAFPVFPESANLAEIPPFPNSPPIPLVADSVSMPPLPESSPIPNFPGLASDPDSTFPSFPMPDSDPFGAPDYWDHNQVSMPVFPTFPMFPMPDPDSEMMPPFPQLAIKAQSKSKQKRVRGSTDSKLPQKKQKKVVLTRSSPPNPPKVLIGPYPGAGKQDLGLNFRQLGDSHEVDPTNFKPTFPELLNAHEGIRPGTAPSIPYGVGYAAALKAAEDHLGHIEYLEDQAFVTGCTLQKIESNIERWLMSWDQ